MVTLAEAKNIASVLKNLGFKATSGTAHGFVGNHDSAIVIRIYMQGKAHYFTPQEADWFRYGYAVGRKAGARKK